MILDKKLLNKLEIIIDDLFENKQIYEINYCLLDKEIEKSKELQNILRRILEKCKKENIIYLEFIDSLDVNYRIKTVLKLYLSKCNFNMFNEFDSNLNDQSALKIYYDEIKNIPLLPTKEEKKLFVEYKKTGDKKIYNKILESNLYLVFFIVRTFKTTKYNIDNDELDYLDLIQEGNLGLMQAIKKFDVNKNCRFSTYATYWITRNIIQELIKKQKLVKIPIRGNFILNKINEKEDKNLSKTRKYFNMSEKTIECYKRFKDSLISLNSVNDDLDEELIDTLENNELSIDELLEKKYLSELVEEMIQEIDDDRLRNIIIYRYGFKNNEIKTLQSIGEELGLSKEMIRKLRLKALQKIKATKNFKKVKELLRG